MANDLSHKRFEERREAAIEAILDIDPWLSNYRNDLKLRMDNLETKRRLLLGKEGTLSDFANGHHYYGFRTSTFFSGRFQQLATLHASPSSQ